MLRYYRGNHDAFRKALDELLAQGFRLGKKEYAKNLTQATLFF